MFYLGIFAVVWLIAATPASVFVMCACVVAGRADEAAGCK